MKYQGEVIDSHIHLQGGYQDIPAFFSGMETLVKECRTTRKNFLMVPQWDEEFISQNELGILYKAMYPQTTTVYAGLDYYRPNGAKPMDFARQAERYWEMGFDGMKFVELKPTVQKHLGFPWLSDSRYDELFAYLEEEQIPVLLHVADPETFWDGSQCPPFAHENGWFYGDGTFSAKQELQEDVEKLFVRHPRLKATLAHLFFLSAEHDYAEHVMQSYPNVCFDITPGVEMYGNFSKDPQMWSAFIQKYEDRILFGTDKGWGSTTPMEQKIPFARERVAIQRRFLETADEFQGYGYTLRGLDLPFHTLQKVYRDNFLRMTEGRIRAVNLQKAIDYTEQEIEVFRGSAMPYFDRFFPQLLEIRTLLYRLAEQQNKGEI